MSNVKYIHNLDDVLHPDEQEALQCRLALHHLAFIEIAEFGEMLDMAQAALDSLSPCKHTAYAIQLIRKGSWENARGVLRELIRDFSPRPI